MALVVFARLWECPYLEQLNPKDAKHKEYENAQSHDVGKHRDALEKQNNQEPKLWKLGDCPQRPQDPECT